jgi:LPS-assembly lipoprotein
MMNPQQISASLLSESRRSAMRRLAGGAAWVAAASTLAGCGFKLRGLFTFGFKAMQVTGNAGSPVSKALQTGLSRLGVLVGTEALAADQADTVVLNVVTDQRERTVVGQTSSGQVRELVLRQRFRYSLSTLAGRRLIEENEMLLERNISFSETDALSKSGEEQLMFNDMESDTVQQVLRRLSAVTTR